MLKERLLLFRLGLNKIAASFFIIMIICVLYATVTFGYKILKEKREKKIFVYNTHLVFGIRSD